MGRRPRDYVSANDWLERITRAKEVRQRWKDDFRIPLCYEYWEGRQRPADVPAESWITTNLVYSTLMGELPSLYGTDPYYYVRLKKSYSPDPVDIAKLEASGKIRQAMLNYLKVELDLKSKSRLSIFDAFFMYGVAKAQYSADLVENPRAGEPMLDEEYGVPMLDDLDEVLVQPDVIPRGDEYLITRLHPDDFLVDEDAGPLDDDVAWKAHRIKRSLEDVRQDKRYLKSGRDAVQATEVKDQDQQERDKRRKGGLASADSSTALIPDICVLWEIYDLRKNEWLVIAEGCSEYLLEPGPLPPGIEKDPFATLRFTLRDDSWYPLPPVSQWIDPQREYCEIRSKFLVHRKRYNRKYTMYSGAFDSPEDSAAQLTDGGDGTVLLQNQPMQTVYPIADASLDQQHNIELGYLRQDFQDLAIGPNQRGSSSGVDSATEAGILEKRTQIREGDKQGLVAEFLQTIGRKLDMAVQANLTEEFAIQVTGPRGSEWFVIGPEAYEDLGGEFTHQIEVGASTPQLPEIERAQWMAFLQLLANAPQLALSRSLVKKMAELHHITDEQMVDELVGIAEKIMSGQMPGAGPQGSMPNTVPGASGGASSNPIAAVLGQGTGGVSNVRSLRGGAQR